jgi:hypothetical protein
MRLRPTSDWGKAVPGMIGGTSHIRYPGETMALRLTTSAPVGYIHEERWFRIEGGLHFFLGPDESFTGDLAASVEDMHRLTVGEWQTWVRGLAVPLEWQEAVIRSAITLKLCQHGESGAIVAALTTSIPEHHGSERNWDYRYCWVRDAYYTVQALNRLGALDVLENYLVYLRNIVDAARGGISSRSTAFWARRCCTSARRPTCPAIAAWGRCAWAIRPMSRSSTTPMARSSCRASTPFSTNACSARAGLRISSRWNVSVSGRGCITTSPTRASGSCAHGNRSTPIPRPCAGRRAIVWPMRPMCWGCRPQRPVAEPRRHDPRQHRKPAWRPGTRRLSATFSGDDLDASVLQLLDLRFLSSDDPRFLSTMAAVEEGLRRGSHMLRYATEDDFGLPQTAFNVCTFWLIEALHFTGRDAEARALFEEMLSRRTAAGLLSEDIDPHTGELWGNYPQTYSLVGIINCAVLLSKPWSSIR